MLKRIYIDNFRCLVNFELRLDRLNLLLGENGSGKTTVFDVLRRLQDFLAGRIAVDAAFPSEDLTRWQKRDIQRFELEAQIANDTYVYSLSIWHDASDLGPVIGAERLAMNEGPLYEYEVPDAQLYNDDFTKGPVLSIDSSRSGVGSFAAGRDNKLLMRFRDGIGKIIVAKLYPGGMGPESSSEQRAMASAGENFASWFRYISQEHQGNVVDLTPELRKALSGFDSFSLREAGEKTRVLKVLFRSGGQKGKPIEYRFDELSDGQRQLIVLYTLLYGIKGEGYSLFLDEPENYVALREIQPWLMDLHDACGESISQAVLISHHPQVIDYLTGSAARWFDRPDNGPTRVSEQGPQAVDGLTTSETIARGWQS